MRSFARPMSIDRLSVEARVLYSMFCLFMLCALISSVWIYLDNGFAFSSAAVTTYYRGDASETTPMSAGFHEAASGPALDIPVANDRMSLHTDKSVRQVIETFHFHMFSVPLCLLVVGHIFMMCRLRTRTKVALLVAAGGSTFTHVAAPLLVRCGSPSFSSLFTVSAMLMLATWGLLLVLPLIQMWSMSTDEGEP